MSQTAGRTPGPVPQPAVSEEQVASLPHGVDLCFQTFGDPEDPTVLLVMGLGGPMIWWDDDFCAELAARGFHVVRYDNRDTGRSSRARGRVTRAMLVQAFLGRPVRAPYRMHDLAEDAFALLDHLGAEAAHVVGVSMGGMIAQTMALADPARVRSLTSIMSSTGRRTVGWQHPRLLPGLWGRGRADRETYAATSAAFWKLIASPGYPFDEALVLERARNTYDRGVTLAGVMRQMVAVLTQPDRTRALRDLHVPTLVIHGLQDAMVHVSGGRATAQAVPGAELLLVPGMGHDMPRDLHPTIIDAIERLARHRTS